MKRFLLIFAAVLSLASCSAYRYVAKDAPEIEEMTLVIPYSRIYYVDKEGDKYDSLRSSDQQKMLAGILMTSGLNINKTINVEGLPNQEELDADILFLPGLDPKKVDEVIADGPLEDLIRQSGARYGMVFFSEGFIKDKALYRKELTTAILAGVAGAVVGGAIGGATGVYVSPVVSYVGMAYGTALFTMVVDTETNKIVYYNRTKVEEVDPMKMESISSLIQNKLLRKFPAKTASSK
ncbi:MAG: hypothetical protein J6W09_02660 [Bacteroidales bacterium]|nr:hypothetical protein [Bacteroidales bacterium]